MKMKKILCMLLATFMVLSLAACGSSASSTSSGGSASAGSSSASSEGTSSWTPSGSIDFICPYAAGGGSDVCARTIASVLSEGGYCPANIVVSNQPGGGGLVGTAYVYGKKGDDNCICTYAPGQLASAITNKSECQWDSITQIALLAFEEQTICVGKDQFKDLDDLIAYSIAHPGEVSLGGCGIGNEDNVCVALLNKVAGAKFTYVLYDSAGDMLTAILGGHLTGGIFNPSECVAQVTSGDVDCLASFSTDKLSNIPGFENVPTCKDLGYDINFRMFRGVAGSPEMSPEALAFWQEAFKKLSEDPSWTQDYLAKKGLIPAFMVGDELTQFLKDQYKTYYDIQTELGIIK